MLKAGREVSRQRPAFRQAQELSAQKGTDLLVLLAIASHAYPDGRGAWPGMETIAHLARVSTRTAERAVQRLEAAGEIRVQRKCGPRGTNVYQLTEAVLDQAPDDTIAPVTAVSGYPDAQVSGAGDAWLSGAGDVQVSGSRSAGTRPRHPGPPTRHPAQPNPTSGSDQPVTWVSPEPSRAIAEAVPRAIPARNAGSPGGRAALTEQHLRAASLMEPEFAQNGADARAGALAYVTAVVIDGMGITEATALGHRVARGEEAP